MRIIVALSIYVHRNWVIQHVVKAHLLQVSLQPVDVKVNHDFFESAIRALEAKVAVLSLDPVRGRLCRHVWAFDKTALL